MSVCLYSLKAFRESMDYRTHFSVIVMKHFQCNWLGWKHLHEHAATFTSVKHHPVTCHFLRNSDLVGFAALYIFSSFFFLFKAAAASQFSILLRAGWAKTETVALPCPRSSPWPSRASLTVMKRGSLRQLRWSRCSQWQFIKLSASTKMTSCFAAPINFLQFLAATCLVVEIERCPPSSVHSSKQQN